MTGGLLRGEAEDCSPLDVALEVGDAGPEHAPDSLSPGPASTSGDEDSVEETKDGAEEVADAHSYSPNGKNNNEDSDAEEEEEESKHDGPAHRGTNPGHLSPKAMRVLGDPMLFPPKAQKVLGMHEMTAAQLRNAYKSHLGELDRVRKLQQQRVKAVAEQPPTREQLALPHPGRRISSKALQLLGDDALAEASRRVVTNEERQIARKHPKVFQLLGEPSLVADSPKVLHRLGSDMHAEQRRAQIRQKAAEADKERQRIRRQLMATLKAQPTPEQLRLPPRAETQVISDKALRFFGEPLLEDLARRVVTPEMRKNVNAKTLRLFGDSALLSDKEKQILGSLDFPSPRSAQASWMWATLVTPLLETLRRK